MLWLANNWPILVVSLLIIGYIYFNVRDYIGHKSKVLGRAYK